METVSVVVPVYNHEKYIGECVESILAQTYPEVEVVVVDDGSTDGTPEVLARYREKIKIIRQENQGASATLNRAIEESRGKYVGWVSSDDAYEPTKIEEQMKFMREHPDMDLTYTDFSIIDGKGNIIKEVSSPYYKDRKTFLYKMLIRDFINGSSIIVKRECFEKVGLFDREMLYHADANMWFRMLKDFNFGHIPQKLLRYRWHESNMSHHTKNMRDYRHLHYKKVFDIYSMEELVPQQLSPGHAHFEVARILLRYHSLYSLAFSTFLEGFKKCPNRWHKFKKLIFFSSLFFARFAYNLYKKILRKQSSY